jgi:hypothetical protein
LAEKGAGMMVIMCKKCNKNGENIWNDGDNV